MDQAVDQEQEIGSDGQQPALGRPPAEVPPSSASHLDVGRGEWHGLRGSLIAQIFGQFNDQAWKQIVILLAMAAVAGEAAKQERTAIVTMMLLIPLTSFPCRPALWRTG